MVRKVLEQLLKTGLDTGVGSAKIVSQLDETLKKPMNVKAESVVGELKKRGVKPEEIKFSGLEDGLQNIPPGTKMSSEDIKELTELGVGIGGSRYTDIRPMSSHTIRETKDYSNITVPTAIDSTYVNKVHKFKQLGREGYDSGHYRDEDYLMHSRITKDDVINGKRTTTVHEIQSDLHQANIGKDTKTAAPPSAVRRESEAISLWDDKQGKVSEFHQNNDFDPSLEDEINMWVEVGLNPTDAKNIMDMEVEEDIIEFLMGNRQGFIEAPYKENWLRKGMEREVADAMNANQEQLAIPLSGRGVEKLSRSVGVQKNYETTVRKTMEKLAKSIGGEFKVVTNTSNMPERHRLLMEELRGSYNTFRELDPDEAYDMGVLLARDINISFEDLVNSNSIEDAFGLTAKKTMHTTEEAAAMRADIIKLNSLNKARDKIRTSHVPGESVSKTRTAMKDIERQQAEVLTTLASKGVAGKNPTALMESIHRASPSEYGVIVFPKGKDLTFSLYTPGGAGALAAYAAIKEGYTDEEVTDFLMNEQDFTSEEATYSLGLYDKIDQAKTAGHSDEDIKAHLTKQEVPEDDKELTAEEIYRETARIPGVQTAPDEPSSETITQEHFVAKLTTLVSDNGDLIRFGHGLFDKKAATAAAEVTQANAVAITAMAKDLGMELTYQNGDWLTEVNGQMAVVTPGMWPHIVEARGELVGGIAGGIAGYKVPGPWWAKAGASIVGAAMGSVVGTQWDYLENAIELHQEFDAQLAASKAMNTAAISAVFDVGGLGVVKLGSLGWKGIRTAFRTFKDGNTEGAYKALKDTLFITDGEAKTIVKEWEDLNRISAPGRSFEEKALSVIPTTQSGGEAIIKVASDLDSRAATTIAREVSNRAQGIIEASARATDEDLGALLRTDLAEYTRTVKKSFSLAKTQFINHPALVGRTFNDDTLVLRPALENMVKKIHDPHLQQRFINQMTDALSISKDRSPESLLELRKVLNNFKFNKRITSAPDFKAINDILGNIDGEIARAADAMGPVEGKAWMKSWNTANRDYARMKSLEKNVLFKVVNRAGISEDGIAKFLTKYIGAIDSTFDDVMKAVPSKSKPLVENKVMEQMVAKYTAGAEGGLRATQFPMLAQAMRPVKFTTPEAIRLKDMTIQLSNVYKNDVSLAKVTGNITIPVNQSYLTTDPVIRMKFEIASSMFNYVKRLMPTDKADTLAMVTKVGKLLENPLNAKTANELLELANGDVSVSNAIRAYQQAAAKANSEGKPFTTPVIKLYPSGNGVHKVKGTGQSVSMPMHKIATEEYVSNLINRRVVDVRSLTPKEKGKLQAFDAIMMGDNVGVIK
jgi:hypothetical protein